MPTDFRSLPSVDRLLQDDRLLVALTQQPRHLVVEAARDALAEARRRIRDGTTADDVVTGIVDGTLARLADAASLPLRRAINATGVVIHTNLGRAPLSESALAAMREVGTGYSNLEYDLAAGARGSRHEHVSGLLRRLSGAEAALVVNNNAAAVLLALTGLAVGRQVVIGRGELVEIGGGFRIPDVLRQSGAELVEVGTTNRTYVSDYATAIGERTALVLRVHSSNYRVVGFVHTPALADLATLAHAHALLLVDDLGSGSFLDTGGYGLAHEPLVQESVAAGADLVTFSGDKLLGGPQAGILVGRKEPIDSLKRHPLTRALRPDKATLAALGATLLHYLRGEAEHEVPVWQMISARPEGIERRAQSVRMSLGSIGEDWGILDGRSAVGGGSLPGETLPTRLLAAPTTLAAERLAAALRRAPTPVVARVEHDRLVLDLRTVLPVEDAALVESLRAALTSEDSASGVVQLTHAPVPEKAPGIDGAPGSRAVPVADDAPRDGSASRGAARPSSGASSG
ncbi:MAG: L-seryl-tRNA(Sec) selenium transferase [Chloroflexi bacterium]|nr:L-seryl-tRNA(Sec) selenium transferase [Chloroflexota bacterium]